MTEQERTVRGEQVMEVAVFCRPCSFVTAGVWQMCCPAGHVMGETVMTLAEVQSMRASA